MRTDGLECPRCASRFQADEEGAFATCPSCGSTLYLQEDGTVGHQSIVPTIGDDEMPARLGRWLRDREVMARPRDVSSRLLWFPFYLLPEDRLLPAAPLLATGLAEFRLPAGDRKAFREDAAGTGEVVHPTVPPEGLDLPDDVRKKVKLLEVPFREVRFRLFSREYRVWFDAAAGQTLSFEMPRTSEPRLDVTYALLLSVLFAAALYGFRCLFADPPETTQGLTVLATAGPVFWLVARTAIRLSEPR